LGFNFAGVNYYDGQGFMVKKSLGVTSAKELNGATFCLQAGTTTELTLADYFISNGMSYHSSPSDTAVNGTNLTLFASPKVAAATARHMSTSRPFHLPAESVDEKPTKPEDTPQLRLPLA
jgi:general L-amino acid transport system substrate-binding protein